MRRSHETALLAGVLLAAAACSPASLPAPSVTSVVPASGRSDRAVAVTIVGKNLLPAVALDVGGGEAKSSGTFNVTLGSTALTKVQWVDARHLTAMVPAGIEPGKKDLDVATPGGQTAHLAAAFEVLDGVAPVVTLKSPSPGAPAIAGGSVDVVVDASDAGEVAGIHLSACIQPAIGGACTSIFDADGPAGAPASLSEATFTVDVPASAGEADRVELVATATDVAGNVGTVGGLAVVRVAPVLISASPADGPEAGGTLVTVKGDGFDRHTSFLFGDATDPTSLVAGASTLVDAQTAEVVTPPGSGTVDLVARRGLAAVALTGAFTYHGGPSNLVLVPPSVTVDGGEMVRITGSDLGPDPAVLVAGAPARITFRAPTQVDVVTPPGSAGSATLTLTTRYGTAQAQLGYNGAPVLTALSPTGAPEAGGTTIGITGTGFVGDPSTRVLVGTTPASSTTVDSSTHVSFVVPPGTGTADVTLVSSRHPPSNAIQLTYHPLPTVSSVVPADGPMSGGTDVTITGTGFLPGVTPTVTFGGVAGVLVTVVDPQTITARTPAGPAAGPVAVEVSAPAFGTSSPSGTFTYNCTPAVTAIQPARVPAGMTSRVSVIGSCFFDDPATAVDVGGSPGTNLAVVSPTEIDVDVPALAAGTVPVSVTCPRRDPSTQNGSLEYVTGAPEVRIAAPASGGTVAPGASVAVVVRATGSGSPITALQASVTVGNLSPVQQNAAVGPATDAVHGFSLSVPAGVADGTPVVVGANATTSGVGTLDAPEVKLTVAAVPAVLALEAVPSSVDLAVDEPRRLEVRADLSDGSRVDLSAGGRLSFASADPSVVAVTADGVVVGQSPGASQVTVTDAVSAASVQVPVTVTAERAEAWPPQILVLAGQTVALSVTHVVSTTRTDVTADPGTTFVSTNAAIATVDATGLVSPVAPGQTTLTVTETTGTSPISVTVPVVVGDATSGGGVTLPAGDPWYLAAGNLSLYGLTVPASATLVSYGTVGLHLAIGAGGLTVDAGGRIDGSGAAGGAGGAAAPLPAGLSAGGAGGPGAGGGGGGSNGGAGGAGAPAGSASAAGAAGAGGGPGGGGGGPPGLSTGGAGAAGGGGGYGGAGGQGGLDTAGAGFASPGGVANAGTTAGAGSGGGGGDGDASGTVDGVGPGGGGGGGSISVDVTGGPLVVGGEIRADGGAGGGVLGAGRAGGGGGGSGGRIRLVVAAGQLVVSGLLSVRGGAGGDGDPDAAAQCGGGGGGGGGGAILIGAATYDLTGARLDAAGGDGGTTVAGVAGQPGAPGTVDLAP